MADKKVPAGPSRAQRGGLVVGPLLGVGLWLVPPPGLTPEGEALTAALALVVVYWVTEALPLPLTALVGVALAVVLGAADAGMAFAGFADSTVFLLIGSYMLVEATTRHGLDRRIAYALMAHPWVGESTARTIWALGLTAVLISAWINNSATAAMLFPAALTIGAVSAERLGPRGARRYQAALLLMLTYGVSIGGMVTPVGTPTNLLGLALLQTGADLRVRFTTWVVLGAAIAAVLLVVLFGLLLLLVRPEAARIPGQREAVRAAERGLGPWTREQKLVTAVFVVTIAFWLIPGLLELGLGSESVFAAEWRQRLPESVVALLAAGSLFVIPGRGGRHLMQWSDVYNIDWGTVILLGGGAALGRLAFATGVGDALGRATERTGLLDEPALLMVAAILLALVLSELASNTAAVNLVVPVVLGMATAAGGELAGPAVAATLGASLGFMLPAATPPNAMVYGSGRVPMRDLLRVGFVLDLAGLAVIWLVVWVLGGWLLPAG